jgi:sugar lactone lactonase YvrE
VYVSDAQHNLVVVFDRNGRRVATLRNGINYPQGLYVDAAHDLWVANEGTSEVLEYARGASSPKFRLADGTNLPSDVSICPDGTIYVANVFAAKSAGGIAVYAPERRHPNRSLTYAGSEFLFVTCDARGNVFATGVTGTFGSVVAFPGGHEKNAQQLPILGGGNLGGIKIDAPGNLLVDDPSAETVTEYTESGSPTGVSIATDGWTDIALDPAGATLFGADTGGRQGIAVSFPAGRIVTTYRAPRLSGVIGVAFDPGP